MVDEAELYDQTNTYPCSKRRNVIENRTMSGFASQDVQVAAMRRMEEKIRVLVEDLESEQKLRRRVEREKQDLQMQVRLPEL